LFYIECNISSVRRESPWESPYVVRQAPSYVTMTSSGFIVGMIGRLSRDLGAGPSVLLWRGFLWAPATCYGEKIYSTKVGLQGRR